MGKVFSRNSRQINAEVPYTSPGALYKSCPWDKNVVKKLVIESKLAPFYPGVDSPSPSLLECPICMLYYPTLNKSRCCHKWICTECFLQLRVVPNIKRAGHCPFCNRPRYAVYYSGMPSPDELAAEEKDREDSERFQNAIQHCECHDQDDLKTYIKASPRNCRSPEVRRSPGSGAKSSGVMNRNQESGAKASSIAQQNADSGARCSRPSPLPMPRYDPTPTQEQLNQLEEWMVREAIRQSLAAN